LTSFHYVQDNFCLLKYNGLITNPIFRGIRYNRSMDEEKVIRENTIEARPWHMATEKKVNQEEFDRRMAICEQCPFLKKPAKQCAKCGCFMKLKTKIERAHCPIHKW
jgi:hypothetical protein